MSTDDVNWSETGSNATLGAAPMKPVSDDRPPVDPARAALVKKWTDICVRGLKHYEKPFKRMDVCMQMAKDGATKEWVQIEENYVAPILNRDSDKYDVLILKPLPCCFQFARLRAAGRTPR